MISGGLAIQSGGLYQCDRHWRCLNGYHEQHHKLYFPILGQAVIDAGHGEVTIRAGETVLIPGHRLIRYRCDRRMDLHWLHFHPESLLLDARLGRLSQLYTWPASRWHAWRPVYEHLDDYIQQRDDLLGLRVQAMVLEIIADALSASALSESAQTIPDRNKQPDADAHADLTVLAPALAFMDQRITANPPLAAIAASVHLSPIYFHRRFTAAFHITPHAYVTRQRLRLAADLLRASDLPIKNIATRCGYGDQFYFSRAFKRHFRCTPLSMRQGALNRP